MWKRKQNKLQFEWDPVDFEKNLETIRPEFELKVKCTWNPERNLKEHINPEHMYRDFRGKKNYLHFCFQNADLLCFSFDI